MHDAVNRPEAWGTLSFFRDLKPAPENLDPGKEVFSSIAFTICIAFNMIEFMCFVAIFWDMHKHHKRHVGLCLSNRPERAKKKERQNVITTAGRAANQWTQSNPRNIEYNPTFF